jgi:hypothetical protein
MAVVRRLAADGLGGRKDPIGWLPPLAGTAPDDEVASRAVICERVAVSASSPSARFAHHDPRALPDPAGLLGGGYPVGCVEGDRVAAS